MGAENGVVGKSFLAVGALVLARWPLVWVQVMSLVFLEVALLREGLVTVAAAEWSFSRVCSHVRRQIVLLCKGTVAHSACKWFFAIVGT